MRKFLIFVTLLVVLHPRGIYCQLLFDENFSYSPGLLENVSGGRWFKFPQSGMTKNIEVLQGNLSYPGYVSSEGNYIFLEGVSTVQWLQRKCDTISSGSIYVSFLMSVKNMLSLELAGVGFFSINQSFDNIPKCHVYIRKTAFPDKFQLGIRKAVTPVFADSLLSVNETILVVIKYTFVPEVTNDSVFFWINPPLTKDEPKPDVIFCREADFYEIAGITLRPSYNSGNIYIDGIRVAKNWEQAPLPVELSVFTAQQKGDKVILDWKTETEIDNYGFDVERKIVSDYINEDWKKIGFLAGYGNSNVPRYYSFSDKDLYNYAAYSYRLKQMDNNGSCKYSEEIKVDINKASALMLYQNYPNPFNTETTIKFSIPSDAHIRIALFNTLGEKIKEIASGFYRKGDYRININSEDLSSGIYLCLFTSGNEKKAIKISVMK